MSNNFSAGGLKNKSSLMEEQSRLLPIMGSFLKDFTTGQNTAQGRAEAVLSGDDRFVSNLAGNFYRNALLRPAMEYFESNTRPGIESDFARLGGTLSSRRDQTISQGALSVQLGAQAQAAEMLPGLIQSQLRGIQSAEELRFLPFDRAMQFALSGTRGMTNTGIGAGWEAAMEAAAAAATVGAVSAGGGGSGGKKT